MSVEQQELLTQSLCKLGMSNYQARIYSSLASLGPSGVSEIQRVSGVPRTKIYEVLEQLLAMGAVEFQSGRPMVYNALSPSALVDRMRNSYLSAADDAKRLLAEMQQTERNTDEALAWTVRGSVAVRRKAALTIASAKKSVLMVERYPPKLIPMISSVMKSLIQRKVETRVVCILNEGQRLNENLKGEDFVEFRCITSLFQNQDSDDDLTSAFRKVIRSILSKETCLIIVDNIEAFLSFPDRVDDSRSIGLTLKVPGLPLMQRILFEKVVQRGTSRVK